MEMQLVARTLRDLRAEKERVKQAIEEVVGRISAHIGDHDLERYHLGMITEEAELAPIEEHLLICPKCVDQAEEIADYADAIRQAMVVDSEKQPPFCFPRISLEPLASGR